MRRISCRKGEISLPSSSSLWPWLFSVLAASAWMIAMHYAFRVWDCASLCLSPRFVSWIYSSPSMARHATRTLLVRYGRLWYIMVYNWCLLILGYTMLHYGVNTVYSHESSECHHYKIYNNKSMYVRIFMGSLYTPSAFFNLHYGCCFLKGIRQCTREGKAVDFRVRAKSDSLCCRFSLLPCLYWEAFTTFLQVQWVMWDFGWLGRSESFWVSCGSYWDAWQERAGICLHCLLRHGMEGHWL